MIHISVLDDTTASGMNPDYVAERVSLLYLTKDPELILCPHLHKVLIYARHYLPSVAFYYLKLRARFTGSPKEKNN